MVSSSSAQQVPWYKARIRAWSHLSRLPTRKLMSLYLAIFFLFAIFGFFDDLANTHAQSQLWIVLLIAVISGGYAVLYPYCLIHRSRGAIIVVAICNVFTGAALPTWMRNASHNIPAGALTSGIDFDAAGILFCVITSYVFFIAFIRNQASTALRIQNELDLAHGIQRTLVPPISTSLAGYDLNGLSLPSDKVGGDLVDVVPVSRGGIVAYVADVSGHGLQAGILMGMIKTAVRTVLLEDFDDPTTLLHVLCDRLNRALPGVKEAHMYATLSALYLAPDGAIHYTLAAHPAILHYQASTRSVAQLACEQLPVGLLPVSRFVSYSLQMQPGDILAITTDGILEACNDKEEEFGCDRVAAILEHETTAQQPSTVNENPSDSLEQTGRNIMEAVRAFGKQVDDQTLLLIRRRVDAELLNESAA